MCYAPLNETRFYTAIFELGSFVRTIRAKYIGKFYCMFGHEDT